MMDHSDIWAPNTFVSAGAPDLGGVATGSAWNAIVHPTFLETDRILYSN